MTEFDPQLYEQTVHRVAAALLQMQPGYEQQQRTMHAHTADQKVSAQGIISIACADLRRYYDVRGIEPVSVLDFLSDAIRFAAQCAPECGVSTPLALPDRLEQMAPDLEGVQHLISVTEPV